MAGAHGRVNMKKTPEQARQFIGRLFLLRLRNPDGAEVVGRLLQVPHELFPLWAFENPDGSRFWLKAGEQFDATLIDEIKTQFQ